MFLTSDQSNDRDLVSELASQALATPITHLEKLGGMISYNYEVNHHYIFKLPSYRTNPDDWLRQGAYMTLLQDHLSFQIPLPHSKMVHFQKGDTDFLSLSYQKIEGNCIDPNCVFPQKDFKFKVKFFEQLSDAAAQIHSVPLSKIPLNFPTKEDISETYFFQSFLQKEGTPTERNLFKKIIHDPSLGLGKNAQKTSILVHADLHPGNVILDDQEKLIGLLDFDSSGRGDRFWEFRPNLYIQRQDTDLFQEIYSKRTGHHIRSKDVNGIYQFYDSMEWFKALAQLYDSTKPQEKKLLIKEFNKRAALIKMKQRNR